MEHSFDPDDDDGSYASARKIIMHPLYLPKSSCWFDLKVFYVRMSNCEVDESMPHHLKLIHIPLSPDTVLEVNGRRSSIYSDCVSYSLRRDRVDKRSEEVTFVSTDSIRTTGSMRFEVYNKDDMLLSGLLELGENNGFVAESKSHGKKWSMKCHPTMPIGSGFLRGKELPSPVIEVYVAGCFLGSPIILTKSLQLGFRKKHQMKVVLDSIPECETPVEKEGLLLNGALEGSKYEEGYGQESDVDIDYNSLHTRGEYLEGEEDGELSWFNAGVRVGVGIGLGICIGVGIGVGLLVHTYQATTRNFKRRIL